MSNYTTQQQNRPNNTQEAGIDVSQLLRRAVRHWYLFLLLPTITAALAWAYLRYQVPVYEIKSTILIKDEKNKQGISATDLISKEFGLSGTKKMLVDESKIMTSFTVIEKVVRDLKLDRIVYHRGALKDMELYENDSPIVIDSFSLKDSTKSFKASLDILDKDKFTLTTSDGEKQTGIFGNGFNIKNGYFLINKNNKTHYPQEKTLRIVCKGTEATAKEIIRTINIVLPKKESNILEPTITSTKPEKAKDILQKMVDVYNEYNLSDKREVSQNTLAFIEERLLSLTNELSKVEQNVEEYKTREGITADGAPDIGYFFNRLGEYDGELVKLEVQNSVLQGLEAILRKNDPNFELLPSNLDLKGSNLQNQISDYNKLVLDRNRMSKVAGDNNPTLKTLTEDIISVKRSIIDNISRVKQENSNLLAQTRSKSKQFSTKLSSTPRKEKELTDIKRQQNIKEGLYLFLLQKQEETGISMASTVSDARIIDRPIVGDVPVSKKNSVIYLIAIFAGVAMALIYVLLKGLFINTIQSETDIKSKTTMPILAKIPFIKSRHNWVVQEGNHTIVAEMFNFLRSNIQFLLPKKGFQTKGQTILITSARSGEGKSFITSNLGMTLAIANNKTVIVGLDLRRPKLAAYFPESKGSKGISEYLTSELYPQEIIVQSERHPDLFYISSGVMPPNPAELLMKPKMGQLFAYLKDNFDYIIVNTPPVGIVSDAFSLKSYIDLTLFIARLEHTKRAQINKINQIYEEQKLPFSAIVLNGIRLDDSNEDGYYGEYSAFRKSATNVKAKVLSVNWLKSLF
jgi:tyrosine-protein kinase Etk/Wzc